MLTPRNIQIRDNFDAIAPRYDLTNRVLSLGIDLHWRRVAVRQLRGMPDDGTVLDLACGTCDLAIEVLRQCRKARVVGADLSRVMLALARKKVAQRLGGQPGPISLVNAPAEALPFGDASFDAVTIAFGIRNVPDFKAGLREMLRVLRPGGRACILEFSTPPSKLWWKMYNFYFF
ncbi:MAG TPA: ubiquinone/menaquinone biosynthesis methyltransferase, partial [Candidatus Polarisedimenticolia bacterium]|nr:ubiquinone/menaquinone biosynthesis methyltransferase [Candidatus Polarisedimenticolia bacterium]